jgi:cell wall assembly regulator SMI1
VTGPVSWPAGGPWIVAGTSSGVDWQLAAAALAAAAEVRVAALLVGDTPEPGELLRGQVGTWLRTGDGGAGPLTVEDVAGLVQGLRLTHGLVLVVAGTGLFVPLGRGGWTPADLAVALPAPVVVVTGAGPDAANHTTLALSALAGRGIPATVLTIGPAGPAEAPSADDEPGPAEGPGADDGDGLGVLPVALAGRIPGDAGDRPDDFAAAAASWLDPVLHATGGRRKPPPPATPDRKPAPPVRTVSGRRVVVILVAVFVAAVVLACGLAFLNRPRRSTETISRVTVSVGPAAPGTALRPAPPLAVPSPSRRPAAVCPRNRAGVVPARAGAATQRRVDAAWLRIENWLAGHAAKSRRALRPPAAQARIDAVQRQMSVPFPADLVASLRRHDGVTDMGFALPPFYAPAPVDRILADWTVNCGVASNLSLPGWWDPAFVPFAAAGDGGSLLVDQRPGGHGRVGEFYPEDGTTFDGWPVSVSRLLEESARSLETGQPYAGRYRPEVTADGTVDWEII